MLKNQKNLIIFLSAYIVLTVVVGLILTLVNNRNDLFVITFIVSTIGLLLYINVRSGHYQRIKYYKLRNKEKISDEDIINHRQGTIILLIFFIIMVIVCFITGFTVR